MAEVRAPARPGSGGARTLARNAVGSFGMNVINVLATIGTTILLGRLMGVSEFGSYAFVIANVTLLGIPAILGADRLLTRDIAVHLSRDAHGLARGLFERAQQLVIAVSLVLAIGAGTVAWFAAGGVISGSVLAFWIGVAALPFLALGRVVQGGLMGLHHILLGQAPEFVLRPAVLLALVMGYVLVGSTLNATVAVFFHAASLAVACVVSVALLRSRTPPEVKRAVPVYETRRWASAAASLGFLSGAAVLNSQIGVALLGAISGSESAGLYAVAQRGAMLVAFPLAAANAAMSPTVARLWATGGRDRLQRLVTLSARGVLLAALIPAAAFILFGRDILVLLFGAGFAPADAPLTILTLGQVGNAATGTVATLLLMTGKQRQAAVGITVGAVLNLALGAVLIPSMDTIGAATAAAAGVIVSNMILVVATYRQLGIHATALGRLAFRRSRR